MSTSRSVVWVDAVGGRTITRLRSSAGAAGIQAALLACSNADFLLWWESAETLNGAPAPVAAQFAGVNQRASLTFSCADGTQALLLLPCPQAAIFLADNQTVDITNASVISLVAAAVGSLVSASGSAATGLVSGRLDPLTRQVT